MVKFRCGDLYAQNIIVANVSAKNKKGSGLSDLSPVQRKGWGVFLAILSLLSLISFIDYNPLNYHNFPPDGPAPILGQAGLLIARYVFAIFGISAWLLPWSLGVSSWLCLKPSTKQQKFQKLFPLPFVIISICLIANLRDFSSIEDSGLPLFDQSIWEHGAGGVLGSWMYSGIPLLEESTQQSGGLLKVWIGGVGTWLLAIFMMIFSLAFHFSIGVEKVQNSVFFLFGLFSSLKRNGEKTIEDKVNSTVPEKDKNTEESTSIWKKIFSYKKDRGEDALFGDISRQSTEFKEPLQSSTGSSHLKKLKSPKIDKVELKEENAEPLTNLEEPPASPSKKKELDVGKAKESVLLDDGFKVVRAEKTEKSTDLFPERRGDYKFPTLELLMEPPEISSGGDEDHMIKAKRLKETLHEFKIDVEIGEVHTGPVITRYDIHPAAGVRVEKIANLDKNLAMALMADGVRILAPVPGKGCVGVEVPNDISAPVCLKEILQSKAWADANAEIPIVLGKEASGRPLVADLTKMPHLLVAGSTGSGKTVCINAIIASLCYHSSPEDVRFIMVDPKIVEMKVYNDLPHMLIPVVTEPKKVPGALKWLLAEMERRYQIFSKVGVRNIAGFNAKILKDKEEKEKAQLLDAEMTAEERAALSSIQVPRDDDVLEIPENKLPYIVCIIDELADLMMVAQADVETGIARLAQLARAAGIHLIIATQRPSVNVITGVIKANLPSRISFRVASYRDSQTILDGKGAESLIGKGDMLFIPPGSASFMRAQGAFVSDEEINGIVDYLKVNGPPQIIEEVREQIDSAGEDDVLGAGDGESDDDPMLKKAVEIIRTTKRASTSNLQRKLSIGYNRAARIMDELEDRGIVGPDLPGQGREILMDL